MKLFDPYKFAQMTVAAAQQAGLDPGICCAIIKYESNWNASARSPASASDEKYGGAWGLSQLLLSTAHELGYKGDGEGLWNPAVNISLFIKLTLRNIAKWGVNTPGDIAAMHNSGLPLAKAPHSTILYYVPKVLNLYASWDGVTANGTSRV